MNCAPTFLIAGDLLEFQLALDYSDALYDIKATLGNKSPQAFAGVYQGENNWLFSLPSNNTALLTPGLNVLTIFAFRKSDQARTLIKQSGLTVQPNPETGGATTWAQQTLELAEQGIKSIAANPNTQVTINGQAFTKRNLSELMDFRDRLRNEVSTELGELGLPNKGNAKKIQTVFVTR